MLISVDIENFKSYSAATLKLAPLTVLIGANASGKSNAIEALRLLSWIVQGNRLSSVRYAVYGGEGAVRGTTSTLARRGETRFQFGAKVERQDWNRYHIAVERSADDELHIADERLTGSESTVPLYEVVSSHGGAGNDLRVAYNNFARGGKKPQVTCTDQMAVLLQLQSAARFEIWPQICSSSDSRGLRVFSKSAWWHSLFGSTTCADAGIQLQKRSEAQ